MSRMAAAGRFKPWTSPADMIRIRPFDRTLAGSDTVLPLTVSVTAAGLPSRRKMRASGEQHPRRPGQRRVDEEPLPQVGAVST